MASKKAPAKPTMEQAYKAATKSSSSKEPVKPDLFGSAAESRAATAAPFKAVYKFFKEGGVSGQETPKVKPIPKAEKADLVAQAKVKDMKANTSRMAKDTSIGSKKESTVAKTNVTTGPQVSETKTTSSSVSNSGSKAKPYTKLKQASREAERRAFVQKRLAKLGITPSAPGQPRSAEEKAARAKARDTWDKKNPFKPKSSGA